MRVIILFLVLTTQAHAVDQILVNSILMCESSNRHLERDGRVRFGDDGISRGIAQFRKETFYEFASMAKRQGKWPFGKPRWFDEKQQLWLLNWGVDNGYGRRWTCWRKLMIKEKQK
jgi:hypothetical protein